MTLSKIAELRPDSLDALEQIVSMGPQKTERFDEAFLCNSSLAIEAASSRTLRLVLYTSALNRLSRAQGDSLTA